MIWVAVTVAGALGAACRYLVDHALGARATGVLPWGTAVVNVTGSLLAGVAAGLATSVVLAPELHVTVAGGFLGAYTTFSTAMYESVRLLEDGTRLAGIAHLLAPMAVSVAAATAGFWLAS